jgi:hypothetical protein
MKVAARGTQGRARLRRQQGVVFYLVIVALAASMATLTFALSGAGSLQESRTHQADRILQDTRRSILAYLAGADIDPSGRRLGEWRLFADLPIAAGGGVDASEPNYDGTAEIAGCATRTWVVGQALTPVSASGAAARCFGRLPWRSLGLAIPDAGDDPDSFVPWIFVSPNLASDSTCQPNLHPTALGQPYTGFNCLGGMPYPWISVRDERGNVISDRIAIAIILPGNALPGQLRGPGAGPAAYLDRVVVAAGCSAPCQPGIYNNADYGHADNLPTTLIQASGDAAAAERKGFYAMPYSFNDRVAYITIDELMSKLESRARQEIKRRLNAFKIARGYYPNASDLGSGTGLCNSSQRFGRLPLIQGSCPAADIVSLPAWLTDAGWHRYFIYSVSARCISGNSACNAPGLTVAGNNAVNAVLMSPGVPITNPPFVVARAGAQMPLMGQMLSVNPADYLDTLENAGGAVDVFEATTLQLFPNNDLLEILN